jgi:hypothetical protein
VLNEHVPEKMNVLIACEFSGAVRDAFSRRGFNAWSCDLLESETPGQHIKGDVRGILDQGWDIMIAHPPCRFLSYAGSYLWNTPGRQEKITEALEFFTQLLDAPIPRIAIENPRGLAMKLRKPDDYFQPYFFGVAATKFSFLWLKNLPPLMSTLICTEPKKNWTTHKSGAHNGKARSRTFPEVAEAMAAQWGHYALVHSV